jgi:glucose-1-phosphate adenylyltransferase
MDALAGVGDYLENIRQDYVVLASGDLIANIDFADVFAQHLASGADITAVCASQPHGAPSNCNYLTLGTDRVVDVSVNPTVPTGYECLEVYILSKNLLLSLVEHCQTHNISSFSRGVLQAMVNPLKIVPYLYDGFAPRLHSIPAYFDANMALLKPDVRRDLFATVRPIKTKDRSDPSTYYAPGSRSANSLIADGCIIEGEVENSILFRGVKVEKGARVSNCILMQGTTVKAGALMNYVIADKDVTVGAGRMLMGSENYPMAIAKESVV